MSTNVIQPALSSGELSTQLFGRVDLDRYHSGVALMQNFYVDYRGGASSRMGTLFVGQVGNTLNTVRVIKFNFNTSQNYALEFGQEYIRVIRDGGLLVRAALTISGVSQAAVAVMTVLGDSGLVGGDQVVVSGVAGMTELNGRTFWVEPLTPQTFQLRTLAGDYVDSSGYTAYTSGGTADALLRIPTPYQASDLRLLNHTQSADVMTLTHSDYPVYELRRNSEENWTLEQVTFATDIDPPTSSLSGIKSESGKTAYSYIITSISESGQESIGSSPIEIRLAVNFGQKAGSMGLSWLRVDGAVRYYIYKANPVSGTENYIPTGSLHGYIGSTTNRQFTDTDIIPDFTRTPPEHEDPFENQNYPACSTYFQQRKVYAGGNQFPETFNMSKTGAFDNFDQSIPAKDDDAISGTLASREINAIKQMVPMPGGLIMFTSGSAFQVSGGGSNDSVTPAAIVATPQGYNGAADIEPIPIDYNILYVQSRGSIVRALAYNFYTNIYSGTDLSIFSSHLFINYEILDWAYAEEPFKIVWVIRDDGRFLSLTYLAEQKISGWAQHASQGVAESCCSIQEGNQNVTYFVFKRYVDGAWVRYIERMAERVFKYGAEDAWCVDSALQNTLPTPDANLTASAATGTGVTFTADADVFAAGDVDKILRMGGGIATITAYTSARIVVGTLTRDIQETIPEDSDDTPLVAESGDWSMTEKFTTFSGLEHLEGKTVTGLGDGNTIGKLVVTNGAVTLPAAVSKATIGLGYHCRIQTLPLDTGNPTINGKRKRVNALTVRVAESRGLKCGSDFTHLTEFKERTFEEMGAPIELITADEWVRMDPNWQVPGQIAIEQSYPLPASVLAIIPEITVGDTSK